MYSKQILKVYVKTTEKEVVERMVKPVCDFADKHDIHLVLSHEENGNCIISSCEVEGKTSAYCKGMVQEIKQMLKDIFKCKIDVVLYAY